ncbi:DnaA N-terminal domain-containing protein [Oceanicola sp. S124]|uniref:DnaA N-terminal domain-containing protein n=1 Tax=Oceanicola sp. S124 TaxID=1042378 RepID=UPI0002557EA4|nr:DnaA N-terminal domain-containing protein [Oceanicola sp. S124]
MANTSWGELKETLRTSVSEHNYTNWIAPLELLSLREGVATMAAPSGYAGTYVQRHFEDDIPARPHRDRPGGASDRLYRRRP